jgi:hypothetical protein
MHEAIVFAATCPRCKREQLQTGYTLTDLSRLLDGGHPIEAFCEFCDEFWAVGVQKRVELGEFVAGACQSTSPSSEKLDPRTD